MLYPFRRLCDLDAVGVWGMRLDKSPRDGQNQVIKAAEIDGLVGHYRTRIAIPALGNTLPDGDNKGVCYDDQRQAH